MVLKVNSISFVARTDSKTSNHNQPTPAYNTVVRTVTATRTREGVRLPKWHSVIENGGNATTALSATYDTVYCEKGSATINGAFAGVPGSFFKGEFKGFPNYSDHQRLPMAPSMSSSFADNRARAKFYKRLREIEVQFSGPTFLGEFRQTMQMFRRPLAALHSNAHGYLDALGKAKRASPKHWIKTISGLWLEKSFGWDPLLRDIEDANHAYNRFIHRLTTARVASASWQDFADKTGNLQPFERTGSSFRNVNSSGIYCQFFGRLVEETVVRYKGRVDLKAEATRWDNAALFGFTPSEFFPTAWELLPWSFLADYFVNIGDIITAGVTSTRNVAFVNRTVVQKTHYEGTGSVQGAYSIAAKGAGAFGACYGSLGKWELTRKVVTRSPNSGIPMPDLTFAYDLADKQLFNIAALLGQARLLHPQNHRSSYHFRGYGR